MQGLPLLVRIRDAHHHHETIVGAQAPERTIHRVVGEVTNPGRSEKLARLAGLDVVFVEVAIVQVVGRVEQLLALRIVGERCDTIRDGAFDFSELGDGARCHVDADEMGHASRVADCRVQLRLVLAEVRARNRAKPAPRDLFVCSERMLAHGLEVGFLEFVFPANPLLPRGGQRLAIDTFEIIRVVAFGAVRAPQPVDEFLGRVLQG